MCKSYIEIEKKYDILRGVKEKENKGNARKRIHGQEKGERIMNLEGKKIGVAFTGSFCTFEKAFTELQKLKDVGADIYPILSNASQSITSRFGSPAVYMEKIKEAGYEVITPVIVSNTEEYWRVEGREVGRVKCMEDLIKVLG